MGREGEKDHLSSCVFPSKPFPVSGIIYEINERFMVPLVCQADEEKGPILNVWFMIDTTSPYTFLTEKTINALFGPGKRDSVYISLQVCFIITNNLATNFNCLGSKYIL